MGGSRHLGGNGCERLAPQIRIGPVAGNVALKFVSEAVIALPDCDLSGEPEGAPQTRIAELGDLGLATELAGLVSG